MKILSLVGARPQFIKEALVGKEARETGAWEHRLVHSGQHYDTCMSDIFFQELHIPAPDYHLGVGSGTHGAMTAAILEKIEKILLDERPDGLLVYGDTNTTLAGALAAVKLCIPVIHIEAGIRMAPKTMPEEINRALTDRMATLLCCCSDLGRANLAAEGLQKGVIVTGDVMYDLFLRMRSHFSRVKLTQYGVNEGNFILATLHRDYNVDNPNALGAILQGLMRLKEESSLPVLLPVHPRTRKRIDGYEHTTLTREIVCIPPIGYLELMALLCSAAFVVTDSGGLQKEAFYAGKRAIVIMPDTGWRELIECGWNILVAPDENAIALSGHRIHVDCKHPGPLYGDGHAAENIVKVILNTLK